MIINDSIKLYIGITILIFWVSSASVLLILLMQLVNIAKVLTINFLSVLFICAAAADGSGTAIVSLTYMYATL